VYRIIDANLNRAREGLRVLEDRARFLLGDRGAARRLRWLRHAVGGLADGMQMRLLAARDVAGDVGRAAPSASSGSATANFKRVQEALRSLEECGVRRAARLRFEAYELERRLVPALERARRLADACVYVLLEPRGWRRVIDCGADLFQLRAPGMEAGQLFDWARRVRRCTDALLIVNDRADVAEAAGADGVHLGGGDLSVAAARRVMRADRIVGATTHTLAEARAAVRAGADYISVGPMYRSGTKPELEPRGFSYARRAVTLSVPAFAIGGIGPSRIAALRRVGLTRVAVCEAVMRAKDPARVVRALRRIRASRVPAGVAWRGTSRR
jgi:thiamine-phosphate pyrophosphorylase